jgi:hypothetical protein
MNPYQLIDYLNDQNIFLSINNGKLAIDAPAGFIAKELIATIECSKRQIMEIIDVKGFLGDGLDLYENKEEAIKNKSIKYTAREVKKV